ncbi:beta-mannosidase [Plectosphaerella cucumerina]|uniref:Beta-mannosidase B n=1 Tax=Plectosphaerella cucumerina TaxID=40658 RepID=A0A8K0TC14_9PEZI|nr:beta-mannosidase [Plectosphaerella cucumerina]
MLRSRVDLQTGWTFRQRDDESPEAWLPVLKVPSQVHVDLLANKKIPDPFIDTNELAVQWIAEREWVYRVVFDAPAQPSEGHTFTDLVFEGLDTLATVTLNGIKILKAENMHVSYRVSVDDAIKPGASNTLEIIFDSALLRGRELVESHPEHQHWSRQTENSRIPVRKAQYNWGWDWGPILMTAGPWRPVYLEQYTSMVEDVWAQYTLSDDFKSASGRLVARIRGSDSDADRVLLSLSRDGKKVFEKSTFISDGLVGAEFTLDDVSLWHPFGYGAQDRYQLSAELLRADTRLDAATKFIGFRRSELIQEPDSHGKSFYFRINGIDVFAGGSCWIPGDSFLAQMSPDRYRSWMKLLARGNQIMIRVWGGGIYEDDAFLDACDELGILIWHDFAFACGNYPAYPAFLENVEHEARQNLRRMRTHPSVVIWAGSNEDYQVLERYKLEYNYEDKDPQSWLKTTFPARYTYEYLLPKLVEEEDPGMPYHPTSPWGDGKISSDPTVGDIHQWDIWHGQMKRYQDCSELSGRFISEFGMEGYPHLSTTNRMITSSSQRHPGSRAMDFRNKAIDHERRLVTYVAENLQIRYDLPGYTHLTQVVQAEAMHFAYKTWRRMWGTPGARRCGGVLVWQLNDCWPTMSWAVVDYHGVPKPAYYAIARALRPLDVGVSRSCPDWTSGHADPTAAMTTEFEVWIASSRVEAVKARLEVKFISIGTGKEVRDAIIKDVMADANATTEVIKDTHSTPGNEDGTAWELYDPFVVHAVLRVDGQVVATDTAWPHPLKYLDFSSRNVRIEASPNDSEVRISTEKPIKSFVFEEEEGMELSDNGFDVVPGETVTVQLKGKIDTLRWTYVGAEGTSSTKSRDEQCIVS